MTNLALLTSLVSATQSNSFLWLAANDYQPLVDAGYAETNATVPGAPEGQLATRATPAGIAFSQNPVNPTDTASGFGVPPQTANTPASNPLSDPNTANASAASFVQTSTPVADTSTTAQAAAPSAAFTMVSDFQPPAPKARTRETSGADEKYPFGSLAAPVPNPAQPSGFDYSSIFVPSTNYSPKDKEGRTGIRTPEDMAFSLQSACSAANRRYADKTATVEGAGLDGKKRKKHAYTREFKVVPYTQNGVPGAIIYRAS